SRSHLRNHCRLFRKSAPRAIPARHQKRFVLPGPRIRPVRGSRASPRGPREGSFFLQHGTSDPKESPVVRILFFRFLDHDPFYKDGCVQDERLVLPAFAGEGDPVRPHVLLQAGKCLPVDLPSQPVCRERCGKDPGNDGPESGGYQLFHVEFRVSVPERVETPEIEVPADALDPGSLVHGKEGTGHHAFNAILFHGKADGTRKVTKLGLLDPLGLDRDKREPGSLSLQWHKVCVGGVEHVALFVPGPDRDDAGNLLLLHGEMAGKPRVLAPGTENAEFHSRCTRPSGILNLSLSKNIGVLDGTGQYTPSGNRRPSR